MIAANTVANYIPREQREFTQILDVAAGTGNVAKEVGLLTKRN